jgi:two-component system response regulator HydG
LADAFFRKIRLKANKEFTAISRETMAALMNYTWPGNVRELKSAFEYACVTCQGGTIQPESPAAEYTHRKKDLWAR